MSRGAPPISSVVDDVVFAFKPFKDRGDSAWHRLHAWLHTHSLLVLVLLSLAVTGAAAEVGNIYWSAHLAMSKPGQKSIVHIPPQPSHGPNTLVASPLADQAVQHITGQTVSLSIADKSVTLSADDIRGWLQVVPDKAKGVTYIHVDQAAVVKSLNDAAAPYIKAPLNQVSVSHPDGSALVIAAGRNGTKLGDIGPATKAVREDLIAAKGLQLTLPTEPQPFAAVTPTDFDKLIEVNVASKQMYLYNKGELVRNYLISAGAPATPTPIGQFKIYQKLAVQDMRGFNVNGTPYFQPDVPWINYFLPGGYAIHGVYWHGDGWFGNINSSHGCVGLPVDDAKWVYYWAPIGTTVITHY